MKEMTILSGKGGTGKTSLTAALASVVEGVVFCDNDVDAADLHLIFKPEIAESHTFKSGWTVNIDNNVCTNCGLCADYCRFDAVVIKNGIYEINPFQCEGCRLCERICPPQAISSKINENNHWYVSNTRFGTLVHAKMQAGEENSGKLVSQVRKKAKEIALENNLEWVINDGPPGIGCAAISSLSGVDLALVVIEPTKSGWHDAQRLFELTNAFKIKTVTVINKYDINKDMTAKIEEKLYNANIPLLCKIPFDESVVEAIVEQKTIVEYRPSSIIADKTRSLWETIKTIEMTKAKEVTIG